MIRQSWVWLGLVILVGCAKGKAEPESGAQVYALACARCHGPEGHGGIAPPAGGVAPRNFADPVFQTSRTDDDLRRAISEGKGTGMPPFKAALSPAEISAVIAHLRSLDPRR